MEKKRKMLKWKKIYKRDKSVRLNGREEWVKELKTSNKTNDHCAMLHKSAASCSESLTIPFTSLLVEDDLSVRFMIWKYLFSVQCRGLLQLDSLGR